MRKTLLTSLVHEKAKEYCVACLQDGNALAHTLLKILPFDAGFFLQLLQKLLI